MTHGFDDEGRQFDDKATCKLVAKEDAKIYRAIQ
ncbi:MAG: hypothetical protein IPL21_14625 [Saprospirales bacterium]|nr:hypothetical protein [Saprospirales bacterium]